MTKHTEQGTLKKLLIYLMDGTILSAILFYSKFVNKSLQMLQMINEYDLDIDCVNVDTKAVRNTILNDKRFLIEEVPSILLLMEGGKYKVYTGRKMDIWFNDILETSVNLLRHSAPVEPQQSVPQGVPQQTSLINDEENTDISSIMDSHTIPVLKPSTQSAKEIAEQMASQREAIEIEETPPALRGKK